MSEQIKEKSDLDKLIELVKGLSENQTVLDSNKKLRLRDIRKYIADLNFSFLAILEKLEETVRESTGSIKGEVINEDTKRYYM